MVLPTPPPTDKKNEKFLKPFKPTYYEDLYGEVNPEEDFDRFPDECEEETSSSEEEATGKAITAEESDSEGDYKPKAGFFARFRTPNSKQTLSELGRKASVGNKRRKYNHTSTNSNETKSSGTNYRISPSQNRKYSVSKKLTPRKGGMFATSSREQEFDMDASAPNSAGEMMEDMLRAGTGEAIGFDEGYGEDAFTQQLRQAAGMEIDPELLRADEKVRETIEVRDGEEGDLEDNDTEAIAFDKQAKEKGEKKGSSILAQALATKPTAATANIKTKVDKSAPASKFPSRTSSRIKGPILEPDFRTDSTKKPAAKAKAGTQAKPKTKASLQEKNLKAMTARAATLRNKPAAAKVIKKMSAKELRGRAGGYGVRLRNWKGEVRKQDAGQGIVVIETSDLEDAGHYERCF